MYKSKLQELCQKSHWNLPTYNTSKQGLDHNPSFSATVVVNGQSFHTQNFSKSSRDAQNDAAKIAFDYLSIPKLPIPTASSFPQPSQLTSSGSLGATTETDAMNVFRQTFQQNIQGTYPTPQAGDNTSSVNLQVNGSTSVAQQENKFEGVQHLYKSQLQMYAQKRNLVFPVYSCERQGPPHASRFKCRVTIDENVYECPDFFLTLKEAEHAAAKVALMSLSPDGVQQDDPGFYKNLLQELVQKEGFCLPTYDTNRYGEAHCPVFVSTVEIEGEHFKGEEEKTKKHAEMSAAKVAYNALKERKSSQIPLILLPSQQGQEAPNLLSSSSQSDISANVIFNVPINSSLNTIPLQQAEDHTGEIYSHGGHSSRVRNLHQLEGNCTFYVYIPVSIPSEARHEVALSLKKVAGIVAGLYMVNGGMALDNILCKDDEVKLEQVALRRDFHISLGRTVPIDVNQIDSVVSMLRKKLQIQRSSRLITFTRSY